MSLKLDWGRDGLHFHDSPEDPCPNGDVLERKWCARLSATEVLVHWDAVKERNYELSRWNCQHFSKCRGFSCSLDRTNAQIFVPFTS
ncbi:unnamed protein product [Effrenium voratum]|uniref:Uncharacterized protein n=1 Tax=Effrenium voratum TaxID=2562239 RepID=A0AA36HPL8_9DINO|nr:unnamed protein product [Effrenium voratum]